MNRIAMLLFFIITMLPGIASANFDKYASLGFGDGGAAGATNMSIDGGVLFQNSSYKECLFGLGLTVIYSGDAPDDLLSYPVPHPSYTTLGTHINKEEYGFYGKYGMAAIDHKLYIFALGGFTTYEEIQLAQSTITGWYYTQSSKEKIKGLIGGGITLFLGQVRKGCLQIEYDTRRGLTGSVGFTW